MPQRKSRIRRKKLQKEGANKSEKEKERKKEGMRMVGMKNKEGDRYGGRTSETTKKIDRDFQCLTLCSALLCPNSASHNHLKAVFQPRISAFESYLS